MKLLEKMEFYNIINELKKYSSTSIGQSYCEQLTPYFIKEKIIDALNETRASTRYNNSLWFLSYFLYS